MPVVTFNLTQMDSSDNSKASTSVPVNMATHMLSSASRQSAQMDLLPRFYSPIPVSVAPYPYQSTFSSEQATQMGLLSNIQTPTSGYMGSYLPQFSSASGLPSLIRSMPTTVNSGSQVSTSKKRPAQRQAPAKGQNSVAINQGPQQLSSTNKRTTQMVQPSKVQTESFESVRSKLRESLAASLAIGPDQQNKPQITEKGSPKEAVITTSQAEAGTGSVELASNASASENSHEILVSNEQKCNGSQDVPRKVDHNGITSEPMETGKPDVKEDQITQTSLENETPFCSEPIVGDELLLGHGLCWASEVDVGNSETIIEQDVKRPKISHELEQVTERPKVLDDEVTETTKSLDEEVTGDSKETILKNAESLAIKIEAELFKLFGGVNKKYKEKARSLLFNLKDRNNPELRERVLSGDIAPDRLCSMTAEELASKELSEWRLAKAEELAQMVVLPDTEVDMRRLVKKTHKGEFQVVELEQDDSISVEVAVGESVRSRIPAKANDVQTQPKSEENKVGAKPRETKASEASSLHEKDDSGDQNDSRNLDTILNEKADFMQDLMVEELKDTEFLPPIVSLDEFMQALDTEPPFDNLSVATDLSEKNSDNSETEMDPESNSVEPKLDPTPEKLTSKLDSSEDVSGSKASQSDTDSKDPKEIATSNIGKVDAISRPDGDVKSISVHVEPDTCIPDTRSRSDNIWEGLLQLNISTVATVVGSFRSGEKTSTQDWPSVIEIKGRVRLDPFEKFLHDLPLSRSRAIMIVQFCWKEGAHESGRLNVCETANSYIADQRLGFAEPTPGVELYFCPPHPKTTEMLERHLPKDQTEPLSSVVNGLIGVVVWRRAHVTTISPRLSSHHKHSTSTKKHSSSRRHQNVSNPKSSTYSKTQPDEPIDDVPPGFGPGSARDEDDLPEFDFSRSNSQKSTPALPPPPSRPVQQMRELIFKYGKGDDAKKPLTGIQSWNDDDDDIPEWKPDHNNQPIPQPQQPQQLPPPPQLPPLPQPHTNYQQPTIHQQQQQPFFVNQNIMQPQQLMPMPVTLSMPQMNFMQVQPNMNPNMNINPGWQQGAPLWAPPPQMQPCHVNFNGQPSGGNNGQFYGASMQNGMMGWRPDVPRNNGV